MGTELRHVQIYKLRQQNDSDYRVKNSINQV